MINDSAGQCPALFDYQHYVNFVNIAGNFEFKLLSSGRTLAVCH